MYFLPILTILVSVYDILNAEVISELHNTSVSSGPISAIIAVPVKFEFFIILIQISQGNEVSLHFQF